MDYVRPPMRRVCIRFELAGGQMYHETVVVHPRSRLADVRKTIGECLKMVPGAQAVHVLLGTKDGAMRHDDPEHVYIPGGGFANDYEHKLKTAQERHFFDHFRTLNREWRTKAGESVMTINEKNTAVDYMLKALRGWSALQKAGRLQGDHFPLHSRLIFYTLLTMPWGARVLQHYTRTDTSNAERDVLHTVVWATICDAVMSPFKELRVSTKTGSIKTSVLSQRPDEPARAERPPATRILPETTHVDTGRPGIVQNRQHFAPVANHRPLQQPVQSVRPPVQDQPARPVLPTNSPLAVPAHANWWSNAFQRPR